MPSPNLTDATIEYLFNEQEKILARQLDPLKIQWYQTKYAQLWKLRNSIKVPVEQEEYQAYFLNLADIDGKLAMLQEILTEHGEATKSLKEQAERARELQEQRGTEDLAKRASQQVDN